MANDPPPPAKPPAPIVFAISPALTKQQRWRAANWAKYVANQREYLKRWRAKRGGK